MSLAVTDLMVAILVMPVGILTLVKGEFPFAPVYCLAWICLDVLFCTASIMHLCTISVDRYLSLRYPMKFGRNKTRRRVILKIVFVWLLSIAMSLPLSLMYSKDFNSVLVNGSCQIPDPLYKLIGSIVSFYIPLGVMILTYTLTVRHLAAKRQNLQTGFTHNSNQNNTRRSWRRMLRRNYRRTRSDETDVRLATGEELTGVMTSSTGDGGSRKQRGRGDSTASPSTAKPCGSNGGSVSTAAAEDDSGAADSVDDSPRSGHHHRHNRDHHHRHNRDHYHRPTTPGASCRGTPRPFRHNPSVGSTDTEMTSLDARELWLPDTEPTPSTMSALHQFGAEMLRLSRGLEKAASPESKPASPDLSRLSVNGGVQNDDDDDGFCNVDDMDDEEQEDEEEEIGEGFACDSMCSEDTSTCTGTPRCRRAKRQRRRRRRRSGTLHESMRRRFDGPNHHRHLHHDHHAHPYYHHQHLEHHQGRPTRVRSFHEDELTRNRAGPTSSDVTGTAVVDSGPKIVGTLLKQEFQRKPGLDEEICLLPPPPHRRQRRKRSVSTNSGSSGARNVTAASVTSPSPSPVSSSQPARTMPPSQRHPHQVDQQQQKQQTEARVDTLTVWSAATNASKTTTLSVAASGPLRRAMTQKPMRKQTPTVNTTSATGKRHSPLVRYGSTLGLPSRQQQQATPQRSNNVNRSSVMIRNSYRHGRIIRLEQKATKVLGVVFFTFVFLWTPFFALNLLPSVCPNCEADISKGLIDLVTWLGYASSMVNPVFYTIFNKVFRQAFKRVLLCKYSGRSKRHSWPPPPPVRKV